MWVLVIALVKIHRCVITTLKNKTVSEVLGTNCKLLSKLIYTLITFDSDLFYHNCPTSF